MSSPCPAAAVPELSESGRCGFPPRFMKRDNAEAVSCKQFRYFTLLCLSANRAMVTVALFAYERCKRQTAFCTFHKQGKPFPLRIFSGCRRLMTTGFTKICKHYTIAALYRTGKWLPREAGRSWPPLVPRRKRNAANSKELISLAKTGFVHTETSGILPDHDFRAHRCHFYSDASNPRRPIRRC